MVSHLTLLDGVEPLTHSTVSKVAIIGAIVFPLEKKLHWDGVIVKKDLL